jgi:hypothetical protein
MSYRLNGRIIKNTQKVLVLRIICSKIDERKFMTTHSKEHEISTSLGQQLRIPKMDPWTLFSTGHLKSFGHKEPRKSRPDSFPSSGVF